MNDSDAQALKALTAINLQDMLVSFGWEHLRAIRRLLEWPFAGLARRFARLVLDYDRAVAVSGLHLGAKKFMLQLGYPILVSGQEHIPPSGPALILSNHPGLADTVALFASIPRPDLRIVAADRPFLRNLPATNQKMIYVPEEDSGKMAVLRSVANHLREGGSILTFPAGKIEPDPAVLPGACESLEDWNPSIGLFPRLVPHTHIIPTVVSGVLAPQAVFHPLTRLRRKQPDRERLGATLQILSLVLFPGRWRVTIHVDFAPPITAKDLTGLRDPAEITGCVTDQIRPFMQRIIQQQKPAWFPQ